jgi:hypothetical protein
MKKSLYCKTHKLINMVDITNKKCFNIKCKKQPVYNYIDQKNGLYCKNHKLTNMVDVLSKTCLDKHV